MTPLARLRHTLATSTGRMVVVPRGDLDALLRALGEPAGDAVTLTPADAELLAEAAWNTADGPDERVEKHGPWGANPTALADHTIRAARRCIDYLIETAQIAHRQET